jgi:type IV secretion system protein TrbI
MTDTPNPVPGITDKRTTPSGTLPKNMQTYVLGGLAAVMVLVIWFSGRSNPRPHSSDGLLTTNAPQSPSDDRVKEYQKRIEEETRRLKQEQGELVRQKTLLEKEASENAGVPSSASRVQAEPSDPQASWISEERMKREYAGRFASNIALTLRTDPRSQADKPEKPSVATVSPIDPRLYSWPLPLQQSGQSAPAPAENSSPNSGPSPSKSTLPNLNRSTGKDYRLFEGTILETVLTNRLDGSFSGPVDCMVSYDVYSHDHNRLLIPAGSRVLGDVHPVESTGQTRLAVTYHRLIMPDGYSVNLDQFRGLDQIGETGLRDKVNHHYLQIFGASIALGVIAGLAQANTQYGTNVSATDEYRQGIANSLAQSSTHILDRFLNILPTFTIREGQRVKVYLQQDLAVPAYENHEMSPGI